MGSHSLSEFELLVLLAAIRLGPDQAYTVTISEDIRGRTGRPVRRSTVFAALKRMEDQGLVSSRKGEPHPNRGGRPPRLITVETPGREAVRETTRNIKAMVGDLSFEEA